MNTKKLKVKKRLEKIAIKCVPARIRHCNGFILEAVTTQPDRKLIFDLMEELSDNHGYNIYSLRHPDNDWSQPRYVTRKGIAFNRFGWFLSKDDMNFNSLDAEIRISIQNANYFDVSTHGIFEEPHHGNCTEINVLDYFSIEDEIFN